MYIVDAYLAGSIDDVGSRPLLMKCQMQVHAYEYKRKNFTLPRKNSNMPGAFHYDPWFVHTTERIRQGLAHTASTKEVQSGLGTQDELLHGMIRHIFEV